MSFQSNPLNILVVDDEELARTRLVRLLHGPHNRAQFERPRASTADHGHCAGHSTPYSEAHALGAELQIGRVIEARDGSEALALVQSHRPDAVFMDVCMPGRHGLEVAGSARDFPPVVFVSGDEKYASAAFDVENVVDYLVKPVEPHRLDRALRRLHARCRTREAMFESESPRAKADHGSASQTRPGPDLPHRLPVRTADGIRFFDVHEVTRFYSRDKYACFMSGGREQLVERSLSSLEDKLAAYGFCRIHRSELVNLNHVTCLRLNTQPAELDLRDGQTVRTSRRMLSDVKRRLGL